MNMITEEIIEVTPPLYSTEETEVEEKEITAKFFAGGLTWYLVEYDPESKIAFGFVYNAVNPDFSEWGSFSIAEFEDYNKSYRLPFIERDLYFTPKKFKELNLR